MADRERGVVMRELSRREVVGLGVTGALGLVASACGVAGSDGGDGADGDTRPASKGTSPERIW